MPAAIRQSEPGDHEGGLVVAEPGVHRPGAEGDRGRAELVGGQDPAEDAPDVLLAEDVGGQPHRRRHGGDPVEAVEDDEQAEAEEAASRRRTAGTAATGRAGRSTRTAASGCRSGRTASPRRSCRRCRRRRSAASRLAAVDLGDAVLDRGGDQVRADQAVGARAADEEGAGQQPEVAVAEPPAPSVADRRAERVAASAAAWRPGASVGRSRRRAPGPTSLRVVADEQRRPAGSTTSATAATTSAAGRQPTLDDDAGQQRQEDQLAGRAGGGQHADDQAAPLDEPAVGDRGRRPSRPSRPCRARRRRPRAAASCQTAVIGVVSATATARISQRADHHRGACRRAPSPRPRTGRTGRRGTRLSRDRQRDDWRGSSRTPARAARSARPASERMPADAEHGHEGHGDDDPGVVDAAP